jgi:hypothetical protein
LGYQGRNPLLLNNGSRCLSLVLSKMSLSQI